MAPIVKTVDFEAPIEVAFDTICDFATYPKFLDGMKNVNVLDESDSTTVVEFTLDLFKRFVYTLELTKQPPAKLSWKLVEADMMKKNVGSWKLTKKKANLTQAEYSIDIDFKIWVPGPISDFLVNSSIPATLASFKKEIEKRASR